MDSRQRRKYCVFKQCIFTTSYVPYPFSWFASKTKTSEKYQIILISLPLFFGLMFHIFRVLQDRVSFCLLYSDFYIWFLSLLRTSVPKIYKLSSDFGHERTNSSDSEIDGQIISFAGVVCSLAFIEKREKSVSHKTYKSHTFQSLCWLAICIPGAVMLVSVVSQLLPPGASIRIIEVLNLMNLKNCTDFRSVAEAEKSWFFFQLQKSQAALFW